MTNYYLIKARKHHRNINVMCTFEEIKKKAKDGNDNNYPAKSLSDCLNIEFPDGYKILKKTTSTKKALDFASGRFDRRYY